MGINPPLIEQPKSINVRQSKKFNHHTISNGILLVTKLVAIESIPSPIVWQLKIFNRHMINDEIFLCDDQIFFVIASLAIENFRLSQAW